MKKALQRAQGLAALIVGVIASNALASGQLSGPAYPADSHATVAATRYDSFVVARPVQPGTGSPADTWKALNRLVGSYDTMSLTMDMVEPAPAVPDQAHAGVGKGSPAMPHAGRNMPPPSDPHAGHHLKEKK